MKTVSRFALAALLLLPLALGGCQNNPAAPVPSASVHPSQAPQAQTPVKPVTANQVPEWTLPQAAAGTLGEALQKLGVKQSNGLQFAADYEKKLPADAWDRHLPADAPEAQEALTALLKLPIRPDSTVQERLPRPMLELFSGMIGTKWGKGFYGVALALPQHPGKTGGIQIQLQEYPQGQPHWYPAERKGDGSWAWAWDGTRAEGATTFSLEGFDGWYAKYAPALVRAMENAKPYSVFELGQKLILGEPGATEVPDKIRTLQDVVFLAGYAPSELTEWFPRWIRPGKEGMNGIVSATERCPASTAWTPLRAEWYRRLLDLPVRLSDKKEDRLAKTPRVEMNIGSRMGGGTSQPKAGEGLPGYLCLFCPQEGAGDAALLYELQYVPSLEGAYSTFTVDDKGQLQRNAVQAPNDDVFLERARTTRLWEVQGLQEWIRGFRKALEESGEVWKPGPGMFE